MGLAHDLAARAAEFHAEAHKKQRHGLRSLPVAIAREWQRKKPEVFKEASGGKTEISTWIMHPKATGFKPSVIDIASALPEELARMHDADQMLIEPSATCSRSWRLKFKFCALAGELTAEYIARDLREEMPDQFTDEPPAKRAKQGELDKV
jgi:hypothetical protein